MATKSKTKLNIDKLTAALAPNRALYYARVKGIFTEDVAELFAQLEKDGWDRKISFDYPDSRKFPQTWAYMAQKERYELARQFTSSEHSSRSFHDPEPCTKRPQAEIDAKIEAKAKEATERYFDGWINKLAGKIGTVVIEASVVGDLWTHSNLTVTVEGGEVQVWKTRCIVNRSVYNKLFNQFPTRRQK